MHFPGGVPKKPKKPKILDSSSLAFAKTLKSLVFLVFLVPPQEIATFSTKSLHFPGGVPKKPKKPKIFGLFRPRLCQDSKIFGFFVFFGTSSGNSNVFHQKLAFSWRGTKKTKKTKDFGLFKPRLRRPRLRQDSKIFGFFGFFGTSSGNSNVFHQKLAFSWRGTKKTKKTKDFGLFKPRLRRPRLRQDSKIFGFFGFFGTSSGNSNVFHQKLAFSWRGTKKTKKNQRFLDSSGLAFAKTLKSLVFLVFLVPPQEIATFSTKACIFLEGYQKNQKKPKIFGLFRPRLRQDSKIFGFFGFFGTSSGNSNVFHQKLAFSWRGTKKTKKTKDFWTLQASPSPTL